MDWWTLANRMRAIENMAYVVAANQAASREHYPPFTWPGGSMIVDFDGRAGKDDEEQVSYDGEDVELQADNAVGAEFLGAVGQLCHGSSLGAAEFLLVVLVPPAIEVDGGRIRKEVLIGTSATNGAENVDGPAACLEQVVACACKAGRIGSQQPPCRITITRVELIERVPQTIEICRIARVNDIEIKCRERRAANHRCDAADHDQVGPDIPADRGPGLGPGPVEPERQGRRIGVREAIGIIGGRAGPDHVPTVADGPCILAWPLWPSDSSRKQRQMGKQ